MKISLRVSDIRGYFGTCCHVIIVPAEFSYFGILEKVLMTI